MDGRPSREPACAPLWPWSLRHDLLGLRVVKIAVAWYCIVDGVLVAAWWGNDAWWGMICGELRGIGATGPTAS